MSEDFRCKCGHPREFHFSNSKRPVPCDFDGACPAGCTEFVPAGTPTVPRVARSVDDLRVRERFWAKTSEDPVTGCWEWTAATTSNGYGQFWNGVTMVRAHRYSYELLVGPIPEGMQLDHLCRNRICVKPTHLEPVTGRVNVLRGATVPAANAAKTHCINGHEFTVENTYIRGDEVSRSCRNCWRDRQQASKAYRYEKVPCPDCGELRTRANLARHRKTACATREVEHE